MYRLCYTEWSEIDRRPIKVLEDLELSREELFIRKLVNGIMLRNKLYEHTSNESEDGRHTIYVKPAYLFDLPHGSEILGTLQGQLMQTPPGIPDFYVWRHGRYEPGPPGFLAAAADLPLFLLDHYHVVDGFGYEAEYAVFDADRSKTVFFVKEEVS